MAAPSFSTYMAYWHMLRPGLRVSEVLSLRRCDLRVKQDLPAISVRPDAPGNKGRKVPVPADLVESLADLASFRSKDHSRPMLDLSSQWVAESMKRPATAAGVNPAFAHPHALHHTYGRNCVLRGVPIPALQQWLGHQPLADCQRYVELADTRHQRADWF